MLSCLLLWLRHSPRQLLCPASRIVHSSFITLNSLSFPFLPLQGEIKRGFISFHSVLFHSAGCRPPAAIVVLACAVVRAAGRHVFCTTHCWPTHLQILSTINTPRQKNASSCSVRASSLDTGSRCSHFLIVRTTLFRSSFVLLVHTLPPARGLTSGRPLRSPWRLAFPTKSIPLPSHKIIFKFSHRTMN